VPGESGGDVARGGRGEPEGIRGDADAAEVEAVGIEADAEGRVGLGFAAVVNPAGGHKEVHAGVIELDVAGGAEFEGEPGTTRSVLRIVEFIFPAGIMEEGEETDDLLVRRMMLAEIKAVPQNRAPVVRAVIGMGAEAESGGDPFQEREFGGSEHVVGAVAWKEFVKS
jgi:hypothetical protein